MAVGVGLALIGFLWVGEWLDYFKGSYLIGHQATGWAGGLALVVGVVLTAVGWRLLGDAP